MRAVRTTSARVAGYDAMRVLKVTISWLLGSRFLYIKPPLYTKHIPNRMGSLLEISHCEVLLIFGFFVAASL